MANICLYKIKVKGTKTACYALVNMMPLYSWEKEYISEEGTDEDYTLVFSGACKWGVDCYTEKHKGLVPFTPEEIAKVEDGDGWGYPISEKSFLLGCEIFCNSKDIDDACWADYIHYNKGKQIFDECPKELHIKRGRDYDIGYEPSESSGSVSSKVVPTCKVRFTDNYSYWYLGEYQIGDLVYVDGAKSNILGQVKEVSDSSKTTAIYNIVKHIGNVGLANKEEIESIWTSYKAKERKVYLKSIGLDETINKNKFIALIENRWLEFAQTNNNWTDFIKTLK